MLAFSITGIILQLPNQEDDDVQGLVHQFPVLRADRVHEPGTGLGLRPRCRLRVQCSRRELEASRLLDHLRWHPLLEQGLTFHPRRTGETAMTDCKISYIGTDKHADQSYQIDGDF